MNKKQGMSNIQYSSVFISIFNIGHSLLLVGYSTNVFLRLIDQQLVLQKLRYFHHSIVVFARGIAEFPGINADACVDVVVQG